MRVINFTFKNYSAKQELFSEIREHAVKSFSKLDEFDQNRILSLLINALGTDFYDYLNENINNEKLTSSLLSYLNPYRYKSESTEEVFREMLIQVFSDKLDDLFDAIEDEMDYERHIENGFHPYVDKKDGEFYWRR